MQPNLRDRALILAEAALAQAGTRTTPRGIHWLNAAMNYVNTGHWMAKHGFRDAARVWGRDHIFDDLARRVQDERVLYMEFGVWQGSCTRYWSAALRNPASLLHGFDSFEGLPQNWTVKMPKGHFSTNGSLPALADPRVTFYPGWFSDTFQRYEWPSQYDRILAVIDCDLYSSTVDVLSFLEPHLRPAALLYFDEFNYASDEQRAFSEFIDRTGLKFNVVLARLEYGKVAFELA
ncbi:MAG: class I SAM-dependent methyltransferase [Solirubrobacterales bacterium]|nr:class I SAM-dependent methyltransferase [Solirubrobacterales bacterium]